MMHRLAATGLLLVSLAVSAASQAAPRKASGGRQQVSAFGAGNEFDGRGYSSLSGDLVDVPTGLLITSTGSGGKFTALYNDSFLTIPVNGKRTGRGVLTFSGKAASGADSETVKFAGRIDALNFTVVGTYKVAFKDDGVKGTDEGSLVLAHI